MAPTFIFDSRFTTYPKLSKLNAADVKFITLRRRGEKLLGGVAALEGWKRIHVPHAKQKFSQSPRPRVDRPASRLPG